MTQIKPRLPPLPDVRFDDMGLIHDNTYGDCFFSRDNGLDEARTVFIHGCYLRETWGKQPCFIVAELGFGTGLNFLATWQMWRQTRRFGSILHYVTTEAFLMEARDAARAHMRWAELADLSAALIAKWPVRAYGVQRIWFCEDQICLTILIGDATETLANMDFKADAWFLDGFSPNRNPEMWTAELLAQVARLSAPGGRLATYSVAGYVRRTLISLGFVVRKELGFGSKRQRLEARFHGQSVAPPVRPLSAIILGGGIGGAAACDALARRGLVIDLFDHDPCGRTKASHNPGAIIMPRLDRGDTSEARFFRAAYLYAIARYRELGTKVFAQIGINELAQDAQAQKRLSDLARNPPLPQNLLITEPSGQLFHCGGGLVFPNNALAALTKAARHHPCEISTIRFVDEQWQVMDHTGMVLGQADLCVIAAGTALESFVHLARPLEGRLGQISLAPVNGPLPQSGIAGGPYGAPFQDQLLFGATYAPWDLKSQSHPSPSPSADLLNKKQLALIAPDLASRIELKRAYGRVSVRTVSPDKIPIAGVATSLCGSKLPGLFVLGALGSRGFTTAHLLGEYVAAIACGEFTPMERSVAQAISPTRFMDGSLKKAQARQARVDRPTM
ncbi:tRNA (5-methylaminomethyl-2-thiouridine)(34)-methyltransferase MnmD [Candidatus Phycosocius spiralis]|uniref:tRNA (5-methylaminomethyl-2-thiouridine)(34)-methyltransferase MnmD n=1 Tax=Candidatus Phycosocius spiralis TaxID=2815099 RepID=UPI0024E11B5B|nr:tRNA (5-methylaminomethyl-2-thiouridine)(34)-methyltransferase MnmD [Candidatus Phycosocius spiralis]